MIERKIALNDLAASPVACGANSFNRFTLGISNSNTREVSKSDDILLFSAQWFPELLKVDRSFRSKFKCSKQAAESIYLDA